MPKQVDHRKRKVQIAEAVWKIIVEEGLEKATVRKVAKVARLSVGSLRHYFPTQSELLLFSMELVLDRIKQRFMNKHYIGSPDEVLMEMIGELLPTDEEKRVETEVWFVFSAKTLVDPKLKQLADQLYVELHEWIKLIFYRLQEDGLLKNDVNPDIEVNRLHALIDGLAMNHLLYPNEFTLEQMLHTLQYHLQSICKFDNINHP